MDRKNYYVHFHILLLDLIISFTTKSVFNYHQISIVIFLSPFIIVKLPTEFDAFITSYMVYSQFYLKHQVFEFLIRLACCYHWTISTFSESYSFCLYIVKLLIFLLEY